jgi:hypothetical protein
MAVPVRAQFVLAALTWTIPAVILPWRGLGWTVPRLGPALVPALLVSVALGVGKGLLLERAARRIRDRIAARGPGFLLGYFSVKTWVLIGLMPMSGVALRLAGVPLGFLGCFYVAIGVGLLVSGRHLWMAAIAGDARGTAGIADGTTMEEEAS